MAQSQHLTRPKNEAVIVAQALREANDDISSIDICEAGTTVPPVPAHPVRTPIPAERKYR